MKALLALVLLTCGVAQAKSIPSLDDCKVTERSKIWTGNYTVDNTRTVGKVAAKLSNTLKAKRASVEVTSDVLGVKRFETVELETVLEANGTEVNSCEGVYYAIKSETCTVDASQAACETICKIKWNGEDCR
jgi:hypothetical protein